MPKSERSSSKSGGNFVRRVLSKRDNSKFMESGGGADKSQVNFESELTLLKRQIDGLQVTVHSMQHDTEKKERTIAALAREKEQLTAELKRQRRSNANLRQQLEDERHFYYKEKEQYCHEMNSCKKLRKQKDGATAADADCRKEMSHLKNTLNQALEANYNLSVKFLRMKNTKLGLKGRLAKLEQVHQATLQQCRANFERLQAELDEVVGRQFAKPIPPSSKKYLQVIKRNGALIHENLCHGLRIDRLQLELDKLRMHETRLDTNSRLQFIHNGRKTSKPSVVASSGSERKLSQVKEEEPAAAAATATSLAATYDLMTLSNTTVSQPNESENTFYTSVKCCRTQSAPEITNEANKLF